MSRLKITPLTPQSSGIGFRLRDGRRGLRQSWGKRCSQGAKLQSSRTIWKTEIFRSQRASGLKYLGGLTCAFHCSTESKVCFGDYEDKEAKKCSNLYCPFPCFWNCFLTHLLRTPLYAHICVAFLRKVQLLFLVLRRTNCRLDLQIMTKYDEITLKFVCLDVAILQVVHSCLGAYTRSNYVQER